MKFTKYLTALIIAVGGISVAQTAHGAQLFGCVKKASPIFPLFGKPAFSPATTTQLITRILAARKQTFYVSCGAGAAMLGYGLWKLLTGDRRDYWERDRARMMTALGLITPFYAYTLLYLLCIPTVGTLTMLAGE